ncbi:MAG TPA: class I SAM-dependent methyltransferase [Pyrinomonadaceae bacterium]|jgi:2-polyprenyl-3-methyl-5-hydroxy-6-metoxy-1,4-benzoquinol methylase/ribosomal protein L37E
MTTTTDKSTACRVCGSGKGYEPALARLERCTACGFVTYRDFDRSELAEIYDEEYFAGEEYPDYLGQQDSLRRSMRHHLKQMWRHNPRRGALLEVGCAYGLFLDEARPHFERVEGIDISAAPVAYARDALGLDARQGEFLTTGYEGKTFDVVCMWDTIEHLPSPEEYLEKAARLLGDGGMVFLTTGDIGSLNARWKGAGWRQIHPPSHLHYFSRHTITVLLERLGFEVVGIESTPYYHTLYNVFASIRLRGGWKGRVASLALSAVGERLSRRFGFWINLGDIMFVAGRLKAPPRP